MSIKCQQLGRAGKDCRAEKEPACGPVHPHGLAFLMALSNAEAVAYRSPRYFVLAGSRVFLSVSMLVDIPVVKRSISSAMLLICALVLSIVS